MRQTFVVLVVLRASQCPCKNYNYIFEFVNVMSKILSVLFFLDMSLKTAFFKDITIRSSLRSLTHILRFFSVTWMVRMIRDKNY